MFVTKKKIHEKERFYLEKSIRLLNGKIKKFSLYLKDYNENINLQGYEEKLNKKIEQEQIAFIVSYYEKDYIFDEKLIKELELMKLNYKSIITKLTKKQLEDIIDRFAINFTYESNAIEGNSLTLKDVTILLTEKKVIKRKDLREIYETLNTKEALNLIFENKFKIKKEDIIKLHSIIVKDTGVTIGYKKFPNFLLGRNIKTTSPEFVEKLKEIDEAIEIIPAHAWTPYFGVFGSMTGYDSMKDCFQDKPCRKRGDLIHARWTDSNSQDRLNAFGDDPDRTPRYGCRLISERRAGGNRKDRSAWAHYRYFRPGDCR